MYADDLALIAESPDTLQQMLDIVFAYSNKWRYLFNSRKSWILVFGESGLHRLRNRAQRQWYIGPDQIFESDEIKHLGILRSVFS